MMKAHTFKSSTEEFAEIASNIRMYDVKNREVRVGDMVIYKEHQGVKATGRKLVRCITHVTRHYAGKKRVRESLLYGFQLREASKDQARLYIEQERSRKEKKLSMNEKRVEA